MSSLGMNEGFNERVVVYPLHRFDLFSSPEVASTAKCLCYQYEMNEYGYGPYGFDTEKSQKILSVAFGKLFFLDVAKLLLAEVGGVAYKGLYLCGEGPHIERIREDLRVYRTGIAKARLLRNKGVDSPQVNKPWILNVVNSDRVDSECIKYLLVSSISFFIYSFFMPVGNETLILFEAEMIERIKAEASVEDVDFYEVDSVDRLPSW